MHIWPNLMRVVDAASALMRVHASWVASSETTGTVWKWSYTQSDSKVSPSSANLARPAMASHCWAGSMPTRSMRQPCGMNSPNLMSLILSPVRSLR